MMSKFQFSYLYPSPNAVIEELKQHEVVYAKDQPEYIPLRTLRSQTPEVKVLSRWALTDDQRKVIADGGDIFLELLTYGHPLQPIMLAVSTGPNPVYIANDYRLPLDKLTEGIWDPAAQQEQAPAPRKRKTMSERYKDFGDTFRSVFHKKNL